MKAEPQWRDRAQQGATQAEVQRKGAGAAEALLERSPAQRRVAETTRLAQASPRLAPLQRMAGLAEASPPVRQLRVLQALIDQHAAPAAQLAGLEDEEPSQLKARGGAGTAQRAVEEEEPLQRVALDEEEPAQRQAGAGAAAPNRTGLPDGLKSGIESLSGLSMDGVRVHYNSAQPAQLNALAYAQGTDIHVAPGQEQHLPHEAWHVVQQAQGRVQPTLQAQGVNVNDDRSLESEADAMGARALQAGVSQAKGRAGG